MYLLYLPRALGITQNCFYMWYWILLLPLLRLVESLILPPGRPTTDSLQHRRDLKQLRLTKLFTVYRRDSSSRERGHVQPHSDYGTKTTRPEWRRPSWLSSNLFFLSFLLFVRLLLDSPRRGKFNRVQYPIYKGKDF